MYVIDIKFMPNVLVRVHQTCAISPVLPARQNATYNMKKKKQKKQLQQIYNLSCVTIKQLYETLRKRYDYKGNY